MTRLLVICRGTRPATILWLSLALMLAACSAVELDRQRIADDARAATAIAATVERTVAAARAQADEAQATAIALARDLTESARAITTVDAPPATAPPAPSDLSAAEVSVFGRAPIDSDRLNIIAALAFDAAGDLLAVSRAGEIYRLPDRDNDGTADEIALVYADAAEQLGPVSGMATRGNGLILRNGGRLSLLRDADGDGVYDAVTHLSAALPADQSPQLAGNGLAQAPDGRLFSVDVNTGEILQISPRE